MAPAVSDFWIIILIMQIYILKIYRNNIKPKLLKFKELRFLLSLCQD